MPAKSIRIILDTNIWISFLITNNYSKLDNILFSDKAILIFSDELITEFINVAKRPKFRRYFSNDDLEAILETINEYAEYITPTTEVNVCRDAKDNFLLSLCIDGTADYLISGDNDLLILKQFEKTRIITINELNDLL